MPITIKEPLRPRRITITSNDAKGADRKDPCKCVIARACERQFGARLLEVQVYATKTTFTWSGGVIERYETPKDLGAALRHYDQTGEWKLPPGTYEFPPLRRSKTRAVQRQRAMERRADGDPNMDRVYPKRKKHKVPTRDRIINLVLFRKIS